MGSFKYETEDLKGFRIWADNRQALCDALPYFKSHEGSLYTSNKIAKGFLINKHVTVRDMLGSEVIITTLGGGRKMDNTGKYYRTALGSWALFRAAYRAMEELTPIGVILGDKYPLVSIPLKHVYNVLDFFTITDIWSERDTSTADGVSVWKIRLEKTKRTTESWWHSGDAVQPAVGGFPQGTRQCVKCHTPSKQIFSQEWTCLNAECEDSFSFPEEVNFQELSYASDQASPLAWCIECHKSSKTVFQNGWTCLNKDCGPAYFKFPAGVDANKLSYSKAFLEERTAHILPEEYILQPPLPLVQAGGFLSGTEKQMRVGVVCPLCGCCSRRKSWVRWAYENRMCDFVLDAKPMPFPLTSIHKEESQHSKKPNLILSKVDSKIFQNTSYAEGYVVEQYLLPEPLKPSVILGSVTVLRSSKEVNQQPGGPDRMWDQLQRETMRDDFGLQRNPAIHAGLPSEKLTRHFLQNFGAPYKFAVDVTTKAFTEAPEAIIAALKRMRWAGRVSVQNTKSAFGDGSICAARCDSISDTFVDFNELLFLGYMEDDRIGFHDDGENTLGPTVATLSLGSPAQMMFRYKKKFLGKNTGRDCVLKFPLRHGDMVVMHGTRIHQAYEHAVDPKGKRRFALTSRNIIPETLDIKTRAEAARKSFVPPISAIWDFPITTTQRATNNQTASYTQTATNMQTAASPDITTSANKRRNNQVGDNKKKKRPKTKA